MPELPQEGIIINKLDEIAGMDDKLEAALEMFCFIARTQMFLDDHVIIRTKLEKPSKIKGLALI